MQRCVPRDQQTASTRLLGSGCVHGAQGALSCLAPLLASQLTSPSVSEDVVHRGNCYDVIYNESGGPKNMGQLLVRPHGPAEAGDVADCLDHVNRMAVNKVIKKDIVVTLDCSDLVWPSLWSCRSFLPVIQERLPSQELRDRTQAFAIVQRDSFWMRSVVDTLLLMTQPETIPIFAKDSAEASARLAARFSPA